MASFTDAPKHVARQAKARQPKLHLDTGAEALRALGFQLGENIKMATGWVPRSLQPRPSYRVGVQRCRDARTRLQLRPVSSMAVSSYAAITHTFHLPASSLPPLGARTITDAPKP
jgi:hypothetical protein